MTEDSASAIKTTAEAAEAAALAELYAVQIDPAGEPQTERRRTSGKGPRDVAQKSPAEWAYERIVMYIQKFEETLDADHEVALGYTGGDVGSLRIQGMGFFDPDVITFYGEDPEGAKTQLIQHVSQLNVMLVAAPKGPGIAAPRRIGFHLAAELDRKDSP
ncbi:MAG: DUF6173 family protein [Pseudomonadota bacterium]